MWLKALTSVGGGEITKCHLRQERQTDGVRNSLCRHDQLRWRRDLRNCKLAGAVTGKKQQKLNSCEIPGNLSISGNAEGGKVLPSEERLL